MYKLSKYNFFTKNSSRQLLLFNSLNGIKSLYKIPQDMADLVRDVLASKRAITDLPETLIRKLIERGFIVDKRIDEDEYLKSYYLDKVGQSILNLTILPTEKCNFRCIYCYESSQECDSYMSIETQTSLIKFLKKHLLKYTGLHISWFGGEPLEAFDVIKNISEQAIDLCKTYGKIYTASITTNGYDLSVDAFKKLLSYRIMYYQITIDGVKSVHDKQRPHCVDPRSTYDRIIDNLVAIRDKIKTQTFRIVIRSNFSKENIDHIFEYKKEFHYKFGNDQRFRFIIKPVADLGGKQVEKYKDEFIDSSGYREVLERILEIGYPLYFDFESLLEPGNICYAGKSNSFVITPEGGIYKCTCHYANSPQSKIGDLMISGEMHLNKYKQAQWLCDFQNCSKEDCKYKPICFGDSCQAQRVINKKDHKCPLEMKYLPLILKVIDKNNNTFEEYKNYE